MRMWECQRFNNFYILTFSCVSKYMFNLSVVHCMQDYIETDILDSDCLKVTLISVFVMCKDFRFVCRYFCKYSL